MVTPQGGRYARWRGGLTVQRGEQAPEVPVELVAWIRRAFGPNGERTAPPAFYWPGADDEPPRQRFGLGGDDPVFVEGGVGTGAARRWPGAGPVVEFFGGWRGDGEVAGRSRVGDRQSPSGFR